MKITLLGTGTPTPSLRRMSSGYMVEIGDDIILLDHGPGNYHRLIETGKYDIDITHKWCQAKANQSPKCATLGFSGRELTPFGERGGAVLLENITAV